jgi:hypothetical protein
VDERERQRACRKRRHAAGCGPPAGGAGACAGCGPGTAAGPSAGSCHAPPSADIPAELQEEMLELWDRAVAMSRASLKRRILSPLSHHRTCGSRLHGPRSLSVLSGRALDWGS